MRVVKNEKQLHKLALTLDSSDLKKTLLSNGNGKVAKHTPAAARATKFTVILADPPWSYHDPKATAGGVGAQYPTISIKNLQRLPVASVADDDCFLFLWATMPKLEEALTVMKAWGFQYKTCAFVWVKQNPNGQGIRMGLGHYTRGNAELLLLGTRGHPKRIARDVMQIVMAPIGRHSEKPEEVRRRIEKLTGAQNLLELFGRKLVAGWTVLGNEVTGRDIFIDLADLAQGKSIPHLNGSGKGVRHA